MIHIEALQSLVPNCIFTWEGQEWSGLEWLDERPCPTVEEWENEKQKIINEKPIKEKQFIIRKLLLESDYIELPSFLERKGQEIYSVWMTYRANLRLAYHDSELPIPEKPTN